VRRPSKGRAGRHRHCLDYVHFESHRFEEFQEFVEITLNEVRIVATLPSIKIAWTSATPVPHVVVVSASSSPASSPASSLTSSRASSSCNYRFRSSAFKVVDPAALPFFMRRTDRRISSSGGTLSSTVNLPLACRGRLVTVGSAGRTERVPGRGRCERLRAPRQAWRFSWTFHLIVEIMVVVQRLVTQSLARCYVLIRAALQAGLILLLG
jgi:hypothetical protein